MLRAHSADHCVLKSLSGLLGSADDLLQAFEGVVLCLLSARHGALDGRLLSIDVSEKEADLRSDVCLMGVLGRGKKTASHHFNSTKPPLITTEN